VVLAVVGVFVVVLEMTVTAMAVAEPFLNRVRVIVSAAGLAEVGVALIYIALNVQAAGIRVCATAYTVLGPATLPFIG